MTRYIFLRPSRAAVAATLAATAALLLEGCSPQDGGALPAAAGVVKVDPMSMAVAPPQMAALVARTLGDAVRVHEGSVGAQAGSEEGAPGGAPSGAPADDQGTLQALAEQVRSQGLNLLVNTDPSGAEITEVLAAQFPNLRIDQFVMEPHNFPVLPNRRLFSVQDDEVLHLAGALAARMSTTRELGLLLPWPHPLSLRRVNAFTLGAVRVDPRIKVRVAWLGTGGGAAPPGPDALLALQAQEAKEAASLIRAGCDVLMPITESQQAALVAARMGKRFVAWQRPVAWAEAAGQGSAMDRAANLGAYKPLAAEALMQAQLAVLMLDLSPRAVQAAREVLDGRWTTGSQRLRLKDGVIDLLLLASDVPEPVRAQLESLRVALKENPLALWRGPLLAQNRLILLDRDRALDEAQRDAMTVLIKGVETPLPSQPLAPPPSGAGAAQGPGRAATR